LAQPVHCSKCGGSLAEKAITHQEPVGEELFEIEGVPALVCFRCGETWISDEAMAVIQEIVKANAAQPDETSH
jgi:YgiT-type zinc finger domain-containing protein